MPQSLSQIWLHVIFSTKNRYPFLKDAQVRQEMHAYIAGICDHLNSPSLITGGTADHVHILCQLSRTISFSKLIKKIKENSSKWIKPKGRMLQKFYWQSGYGAFSVGHSQLASVRSYIAKQEEHHRKMSFQEEFRQFLAKYEVLYDERYVWD